VTARVFVPLVGADGQGAHLFEAIADDSVPVAHPARLVPQISELFDFGLYGIGQIVREAVTRFVATRRESLWLSRRNGAAAPWRLRISDLQVGRLSDDNARSAGLGLTVAGLCQAFARDPGLVFATGEILLPTGPGALSVAVGPAAAFAANCRSSATISRSIDNCSTASVCSWRCRRPRSTGVRCRRLRAGARTAGAGGRARAGQTRVRVRRDARGFRRATGPLALKEIVTPRRAIAMMVIVFALAALIAGWTALVHAPIVLAFEFPASTGIGSSNAGDAAPQRARYDSASDKLQLLAPCFDAQREPMMVAAKR